MHYLTPIYKVTIAVFFTAMVVVLFSTFTGCQGNNSDKEVVRWIPAPRDTVPDTIQEDSLAIEDVSIAKKVVTATKPAKKKQALSKRKNAYPVGTTGSREQDDSATHSWSEEFDLDSITLTIITPEAEIEIGQNFQ